MDHLMLDQSRQVSAEVDRTENDFHIDGKLLFAKEE